MTRNNRRFFSMLLFLLASVGTAFAQFLPQDENVPDSSQQVSQQIVNAKTPVLVDFWAPWCMPCRMLFPTVKKLEEDYKGRVLFLRVNVDNNHRIASYFRVSGIPAIFIIRDRSIKQEIVGLQPDAVYRHALDSVLALPPEKDSSKAKPKAAKKN